MLLGQTIMMSS